jgi:hypothetical protein
MDWFWQPVNQTLPPQGTNMYELPSYKKAMAESGDDSDSEWQRKTDLNKQCGICGGIFGDDRELYLYSPRFFGVCKACADGSPTP